MARKRTTTATQPDDARAQRSMEALRSAILKLIDHKTFESISIREITDSAGISYPTFFRRFASKEALLEDVAAGEVRRLLLLGKAAMVPEDPDTVRHLCEYVQSHRKLWTALLTGGAASAMREEFMRVAREVASARPRANPWLPLDLAVSFVTSAIFEIFAWWMRQPEDYPIENVVTLFDALITDSVARRRNITLI